VNLFGHHHAAPTIASRISETASGILHLPLAVWLTIIPVAGGLIVAYVTHRLNLSRDRAAIRREDDLRRASEQRAATRVRADFSFRLVRHRDALRVAASGEMEPLESGHADLVRRAAEADVIDVLGEQYLAFMAVLQREETALIELRRTIRGNRPLGADLRTTLRELEEAFERYVALFALPESAARLKITR